MSMALNIEKSCVFVKIYNHLKIHIQVTIGPHNRPCKFELNQIGSF